MEKKYIPDSEMIINDDGSIFHIHLKPEQLADNIKIAIRGGQVEMTVSKAFS